MISANLMLHRLLSRARLRQLQIITLIAELGSLQKAADTVGLSQPAATHALAEVEEIVGARIFHRQNRGMVPTEVGLVLIPLLRASLESIKVGATSVASVLNNPGGTLRIGSVGAGVVAILRNGLPCFVDNHPEVLVRVQESEAVRLPGLLADGRIDVGLCREPAVLPRGAAFRPLLDDRLIVVADINHPLAGAGMVSLDRLLNEVWAQPPSEVQTVQVLNEILEASGRQPRFYPVDTRSYILSFELIRARRLLDFMPRSVAAQMLQEHRLVEISVDWADSDRLQLPPLGALYFEDQPNPVVGIFIDHLARLRPDAGEALA